MKNNASSEFFLKFKLIADQLDVPSLLLISKIEVRGPSRLIAALSTLITALLKTLICAVQYSLRNVGNQKIQLWIF